MVSVSLMRSRVHIFLSIRILVKILSREFHGIYDKSSRDSEKKRFLIKITENGSMGKIRNILEMFFIFPIILSKLVWYELKIWRNEEILKSSISFILNYIFMYLTKHFIQVALVSLSEWLILVFSEAVARRCPAKKVFLKNFPKVTRSRSLFFHKVAGLWILRNIDEQFYYGTLPVTASVF